MRVIVAVLAAILGAILGFVATIIIGPPIMHALGASDPNGGVEIAEDKLPDTLQGLVLARIDQLPSEDALALKAACEMTDAAWLLSVCQPVPDIAFPGIECFNGPAEHASHLILFRMLTCLKATG